MQKKISYLHKLFVKIKFITIPIIKAKNTKIKLKIIVYLNQKYIIIAAKKGIFTALA
jgi:hypothetical protein